MSKNEVATVNLNGTDIPALVDGIKQDLKDGLEAFYRAGCKLLNLREEFKQLKPAERKQLGGFAEFCYQQTGVKRPMYAHLTRAVVALDNLKSVTEVTVFPIHEKPVRPLTKFNKDPEKQALIWNEAVEIADGNQPTEEDVKKAIGNQQAPQDPPQDPPGPSPEMLNDLAPQGLEREALELILKEAKRGASKKCHPDVNPNGASLMAEVNRLLDEIKKYYGMNFIQQ